MFAGYVPLASQSLRPIVVYFSANYRPHLSHFFWKMLFLRSQLSHFLFMHLPCQSFKKPGHASLLLNLINNVLIFLTENLPILIPYLPSKFENLRPHSSNSIQKCDPIIVTPVVKMRPHPAAHPH